MHTDKRYIKWLNTLVSCDHRGFLNGHPGAVLWFTGIFAPHEAPLSPEVPVNTNKDSLAVCVERVLVVSISVACHAVELA